MPQLGFLADDAIYLVSAKSLAAGEGYRIPSLPGAPAQTKYPPLYPLLLSLVWRIHPEFPGNLRIAALLAWLMLPLFICVARLYFGRLGLGSTHCWILCALLAVNARVAMFSLNLMPELPLVSALLVCTMLADSDTGGRRAMLAGLAGGAAFLLKSAALPLLVTSPLLYVLKKRYRSAALFFCAMALMVAGWTWWAHVHRCAGSDSNRLFYTDYAGYQALNVSLHDYPLVIWTNLKTLCASMGQLVAAPTFDGPVGRLPAYMGAAMALAGIMMLARRRDVMHYHAFAAGFVPLLMVWHYPPVPRFVMPLLPLLLVGISILVQHTWRSFAGRRSGMARAAAGTMLTVMAALVPIAICATYGGPLGILHKSLEYDREQRAKVLPAYRWIVANADRNAVFFANDDAVLYLYTGHPAISLHIPPKLLYHEDLAGIDGEYRDIAAFAARNRLQYWLRTDLDFAQEFTPDRGRAVVDGVLADPEHFYLLHRSPGAAVYEVRRGG